jgi:hypothetical protein
MWQELLGIDMQLCIYSSGMYGRALGKWDPQLQVEVIHESQCDVAEHQSQVFLSITTLTVENV